MASHLKDFGGGHEKAEGRWQAGCKDTSCDEVVETRKLAQELIGVVIINKSTFRYMNTDYKYQDLRNNERPGTFELLARPYSQVCVWMHSVKFQPSSHPKPTQPSVMFPVRMSVILPEASRSTHAPGEEQRWKYCTHNSSWFVITKKNINTLQKKRWLQDDIIKRLYSYIRLISWSRYS